MLARLSSAALNCQKSEQKKGVGFKLRVARWDLVVV